MGISVQNLFQLACSDIVERFKLTLFLLLVLLLNVCQDGSSQVFFDFARVAMIVLLGEICADNIKHSFITKFNRIKSSVYEDYSLVLAGDMTGIGHENVNLDHHHAIVKRVGLAQIPLFVVMVRFCLEAAKYSTSYNSLTRVRIGVYVLITFCGLIVCKVLLGIFVRRWCERIVSVFDDVDVGDDDGGLGGVGGLQPQQPFQQQQFPTSVSADNFNNVAFNSSINPDATIKKSPKNVDSSSDEDEYSQARRLAKRSSPRGLRQRLSHGGGGGSGNSSPRSLGLSPRFTSASIQDLVDTDQFIRTETEENDELVI